MLVVNDLAVLGICLWLSFAVRHNELYVPPSFSFALLTAAAPVLGVVTFFQLGLYRMVTRYIGTRTISRIGVAMCLSILFWALVVLLSGIPGVPRSSLFIYAILGTAGIWGSRQIAGSLLKSAGVSIIDASEENRLPVIIYGAGRARARPRLGTGALGPFPAFRLRRPHAVAVGAIRGRLQGLPARAAPRSRGAARRQGNPPGAD